MVSVIAALTLLQKLKNGEIGIVGRLAELASAVLNEQQEF